MTDQDLWWHVIIRTFTVVMSFNERQYSDFYVLIYSHQFNVHSCAIASEPRQVIQSRCWFLTSPLFFDQVPRIIVP